MARQRPARAKRAPASRARPAPKAKASAAKAKPSHTKDTPKTAKGGASDSRRLDRRDTELKVERIVNRKILSKYPESMIEGAVAADGGPRRAE